MFTSRKRAVVSVINDLATDNRVMRTCNTLVEAGYDVLLVGRKLPASPLLPELPYQTKRLRLFFTSGPLFYLFFNLRIYWLLRRTSCELLFANDLDTLLPNYLVSRSKKIPLIYDSHELFCDVPELEHTPLKRGMWRWLEKKLVPRVKHRVTVNGSIAEIFRKRYGTPFEVVRNIADYKAPVRIKTREELLLPADKKIVLLQGAGININRGAEELLEAMKEVNNALLLVIGGGDVWPKLEKLANVPQLTGKVRLIGKMPAADLRHYTLNADIGVSIDKPGNLNYNNSLPNKIFDYIQAGLPVLASRLPEIERTLARTGTGIFIDSHNPSHIAGVLNRALQHDQLVELKERAALSRSMFSWQEEKTVLLRVIGAAEGNAG